MAIYGFRRIYLAKRNVNNGVVTYDAPVTPGCPISADLQLQFAEQELWCADGLSTWLRKMIGGTVTLETKFLTPASQVVAFGSTLKTRTLTFNDASGSSVTKTVQSVVRAAGDESPYVGFAGFGPDAGEDGDDKFCAFFIGKAKFSPPNSRFQTIGSNITFQTPTTSGRFLPDEANGNVLQEIAICDSEEEAAAWCQAVFPQAQAGGG